MNAAYLNAVADHGVGLITHLSLADGAGQGDELSVTRQSVSWGTASNGEVSIANEPTFEVGSGSDVTHVQFWSDSSGGTYYGSSSVPNESFGAPGTYTVETGSINHSAD